ncbi:MAG: hypothetical protein KKG00_04010, partial [Bacteroidetes bacterium]|nr:hypothetical protein [Bacteroidota bacterium]
FLHYLMPPKIVIVLGLVLLMCAAHAQPRYTPIKYAYSFEAFGACAGLQFALETPFLYRRSSFFDIQVGLGGYRKSASGSFAKQSYSLGSALTYCRLLNQRRKSCDPRPEYHRWEYYFETGLAGTFFSDQYKLPEFSSQPVSAAAQALAGFRIQHVGSKSIQIIKLRFSPFLAPGFPLWAGVAYGVGFW